MGIINKSRVVRVILAFLLLSLAVAIPFGAWRSAPREVAAPANPQGSAVTGQMQAQAPGMEAAVAPTDRAPDGPTQPEPAPTEPAPEPAPAELAAEPVPEPAPAESAAEPASGEAVPVPAPDEPAPEPAPMRETRAMWVSRWDLKEHPDVRAIADKAASANINVILFQVRGQADALYRSDLEPWAAELTGRLGQDPGYDPLAEMIDAAHARGIEVHAWLNVYPAWMGDEPPPASVVPTPMYHEFNSRYGDEWVQWREGRPMRLAEGGYLWANPAHPAVRDRVVEVSKDLLSRYPVDGLQLDYIRYAGREYSDDPLSNRAYAEAVAEDPGLSREDWQRAQVTGLVQRLRDEALPVRPGARLTATAWPVYQDHWGWYRQKDGYGALYQDSQRWSREGVVSAIMPMIYGMTVHDHADRFEVLARDYVDGSQPGGVVVGIGADYETFAPIAQRIEIARQAGARGQALFSFRALEEHDYWAALREGPYRQPAEPNWP